MKNPNGKCFWKFATKEFVYINGEKSPVYHEETFNQHLWLKSQKPEICIRCGTKRIE